MTSSCLVLLLLIAVSGEESNRIRRLRRVQFAMSNGTPMQKSGVWCTIDPAGATTGCDDGQYCKKDNGECLTKNFGICENKPEMCPMMYTPICGCDGQTYGNTCAASGVGTSVAYMGECQGVVVVVDIHGDDAEENERESEPVIIESMSMTEEPVLIIDGSINGGSMSIDIDDLSMSIQYNRIPSLLHDHIIFKTAWTAQKIDLDVNIIAPITLEFDSESEIIYGSTGCNYYRGRVVNFTHNSFITEGEFITTRIYCVGVMQQEEAFLSFLKDTTFSYEIVVPHLRLDSQKGAKAQFVMDPQ